MVNSDEFESDDWKMMK